MRIQCISSVHDIDAEQWNSLAGGDYPFLRHEFLAALEDSHATTVDNGWQPQHLIAYDNQSTPIALMPLFIKGHSYGEYVFDWSWADAYHRNNLPYYPKLLSAIPFTPATGPRFGFAKQMSEAARGQLVIELTEVVKEIAQRLGASSWHCLFPPHEVAQQLNQRGFSLRQGCQFHWFNQDFGNFEDFLATFTSRKRKNLRKERKKIPDQGIEIKRLDGTQLEPSDWQAFYDFYRVTYLKLSGHDGYLNEEFFQLIGANMPQHLMMVQCYSHQRMVAAALFFKSSSHLYGRYWGSLAEFDGLHFEACYYQGIEYAIEQGLQCFDPGAQGEHKIQRGFTPTITWSNHWMVEPRFHDAITKFVEQERPNIEAYQKEAASLLPFKHEE